MTTTDDLQQRHDDAVGAVLDTAKAVAESVRALAVDAADGEPQQQLGLLEAAARTMHEAAQAVESILGPVGAGDSAAIAELREQLVETAQRGASTAETLEQVQAHLVERIERLEHPAATKPAAKD